MVRVEISDLISQKEAAALRGVSISAISDLVSRGRLKPVDVAGRKYLRRADVMKFKAQKGGRPKTKAAKRGKK